MTFKIHAAIPLAIAFFTTIMLAIPYFFEARAVKILYSEQGFFEQASPVLWIIAALYCLWKLREQGVCYLVLALTFLALAAREWDLHKAFTSDSILKINFYKDGFGLEQIFGGLAALVIIGLIIAAAVILIRYIISEQGYKTIGGQLLIAGLAMIVVSKIMDRAPSILRNDYALVLDEQFILVLLALEEGFEFFCPLLILFGILYKRKAEQSAKLLP